MADYSKMATNLGGRIYHEFFRSDEAVVPALEQIVKGGSPDDAREIARLWGMTGPESLPFYFRALSETMPSTISHKVDWLFMLRSAQCAALADKTLQARLVASANSADGPHEATIKTIQDVGSKAFGCLRSSINTEFLGDPTYHAEAWSDEDLAHISGLGIRPFAFFKSMRVFAGWSDPERLPRLLHDGPHDSMRALYRIGTAAAILGHELQIDFVPFDQPSRMP